VLSGASSPDQENEAFPCDGNCMVTRDFSPLEPEAEENKYYLPGVGFVLALKFEDGVQTEDREELACSHDSLAEALADEDCGIADAEAMAESLCKLAPEAFCND
jgi:hypothetical protein